MCVHIYVCVWMYLYIENYIDTIFPWVLLREKNLLFWWGVRKEKAKKQACNMGAQRIERKSAWENTVSLHKLIPKRIINIL